MTGPGAGPGPRAVVVCGVAGSGKTTVGQALACALGWAFLDADDLHDPAAVAKMARGEPLDDMDRAPWLGRVAAAMAARQAAGEGVVAACSALKRGYRDVLRRGAPGTAFLLLDLPETEAARRVAGRAGHFMPAALLRSQFETLEPPQADEAGVTAVDATATVDAVVAAAMAAAGLSDPAGGRPPD